MAKTPRARVAAPASARAPSPTAPPAPIGHNGGPALDDQDAAGSNPAVEAQGEPAANEAAEILDPADFDLVVDDDGMVSLEMLTGLSGPTVCLANGDPYRCEPQEACRLARAEFARQAQLA